MQELQNQLVTGNQMQMHEHVQVGRLKFFMTMFMQYCASTQFMSVPSNLPFMLIHTKEQWPWKLFLTSTLLKLINFDSLICRLTNLKFFPSYYLLPPFPFWERCCGVLSQSITKQGFWNKLHIFLDMRISHDVESFKLP